MSVRHEVAVDDGGGLRRLYSLASLALALCLTLVKLGAWLATGSVALLAAALDALADTGAAVVTFAGIRYAERPADHDHRYGHGKGEALAAFVQAMFLAGTAVALAAQSLGRLVYPQPLAEVDLGIVVIGLSLIVVAGLVLIQSRVLARTGSTAIAADRAHYRTDLALNLAVLAALALARLTGWTRADPAFGLGISGYMLWNSRDIALDALRQLLDRELPPDLRRRIKEAVLAGAEVAGIHDLRTRDAGDRVFVEFHIEVDGGLSVDRGHAIGDAAEMAVKALFAKGAEVTAHLEPAGIDDDRLDRRVHGGTEAAGDPINPGRFPIQPDRKTP